MFEEKFDFFPHGFVGQQFCGRAPESMMIMWSGNAMTPRGRGITTRQMVVSRDFMIQFKVCCPDVVVARMWLLPGCGCCPDVVVARM